MADRKRAVPKIYELHVELEDIEPLVWPAVATAQRRGLQQS